MQHLHNVGAPAVRYKKAIRTRRGAILRHLVSYSVHVCRSLAHKPKEVLIMKTSLAGLYIFNKELSLM